MARMLAALPESLLPFHQLLREFTRTKNETGLLMVLSELDRRSSYLRPTTLTYRYVIAAYGAVGRYREARTTFTEMRRAGVFPDTSTCNALLGAICHQCALQASAEARQERDISNAALKVFVRFTQLFNDGLLEEPDLVTYNILLKACSIAGDVRRTESVLGWIKEDGLPMSVFTITSLIRIFDKAGHADGLMQVVELMESGSFKPSRQHWRSIVAAFGRLGHLELAFSIWTRPIIRGSLPKVEEYNTLLEACGICKQGSKALDVFWAMRRAGHQPTLQTYATVMSALQSTAEVHSRSSGSDEQVKAALGVLEDLKASGLTGTTEIYTRLVSICTELGYYASVRLIITEMEELGLRVDTICGTALIKGYGEAGWVDEAIDMYNKMREGPAYMQPSRGTHLELSRICRQAGRLDMALQAYNNMRSAGFPPCDREFQAITEAVANEVVEGVDASAAKRSLPLGVSSVMLAGRDLAEGDALLDLAGLSPAEARAKVLGLLHAAQTASIGNTKACTGLLVTTGSVGDEASAQLQKSLMQLFSALQIDVLASKGAATAGDGGSGGVQRSLAVKVPKETLLTWLTRKAK